MVGCTLQTMVLVIRVVMGVGGSKSTDVVSWSALVSGYARLGHGSGAKEDFEDMENKGIELNVASCNLMITGFNQNGCNSESVLT
ncbi:hypothetical protein RHSIM_RhsimUnG0036300 [Rhododendron simsii]|uniref:Pentatricopeptide repeat-containing protein n=1 Tax=Rhododendron simsii TaxID=118357 RepID=A0A834FVZ2_RHOSS|nr:hypothetical protein RHSIM_RhsimUnG0036300 [Rhododendron simsii]